MNDIEKNVSDLETSILTIKSDMGHIKTALKQLCKRPDNDDRIRDHNLFSVYETLFLDPNKSEDLDAYMR